ncbi:hypothetical protein ONS96_003800 [Cadophora gregata f. sp. sojae]|nr:hypothetical protein ONS96_003800 [Cadophora gregata f. sp. sojae]
MTANSQPRDIASSAPSSSTYHPPPNSRRKTNYNFAASQFTTPNITSSSSSPHTFYKTLPRYAPTPLTSLPSLAQDVGVAAVYIKDESQRFGLPAFKILGASWAAHRALCTRLNIPITSTPSDVREGAKQGKGGFMLVAATEGNHGRAVARVADMLGLQARILVPKHVGDDAETVSLIRDEGAEVIVTDFDYDSTVLLAKDISERLGNGILVQDTAFEGYGEIPEWIVEGYSTMLSEIDTQLDGTSPDLIVRPVGVGSLAQAVISYSKRYGRNTRVLAVEPDTAACLCTSLSNGTSTPVRTSNTIMAGMNCGTLYMTAWPILKAGVDVSVTVSDIEAHEAVQKLLSLGVEAGPCGAATLAGLRYAVSTDLNLKPDSIIVLLYTEGARAYATPLDATISDPVTLARALVRIDSTNPGLSKSGGAGETAIAEYITAWLSHRNIETHWLESTRGRPSVVGIVRGIGGGKALMLNGHTDTVTTAGYEGNPLSGDIYCGKIYGRGIIDMKAGIAAALVALARAKETNLRGDVIFAGVADEENLSLGTEEILAAGWTADGAIVMEPTMLDIVLSHKGFVWFKVNIYSRAAHGSQFDIGIDAICKAGYFLVELDKYSKSISAGKRDQWLKTGSVHASLIQGGEEPSSYPAMCSITIERRTVPGKAEETTLQELRSILEHLTDTVPEFKYDILTTFVRPAFQIAEEHPLVRSVISAAGGTLGRNVKLKGERFWADTALLMEAGIPALLFGPDGEGLHGTNEWVTIESVTKLADAIGRVIEEFCA